MVRDPTFLGTLTFWLEIRYAKSSNMRESDNVNKMLNTKIASFYTTPTTDIIQHHDIIPSIDFNNSLFYCKHRHDCISFVGIHTWLSKPFLMATDLLAYGWWVKVDCNSNLLALVLGWVNLNCTPNLLAAVDTHLGVSKPQLHSQLVGSCCLGVSTVQLHWTSIGIIPRAWTWVTLELQFYAVTH